MKGAQEPHKEVFAVVDFVEDSRWHTSYLVGLQAGLP